MKFFTLIIILVLLLFVSSARADCINLSVAQSAPNIAEIHVNDDHVRVVLERRPGQTWQTWGRTKANA